LRSCVVTINSIAGLPINACLPCRGYGLDHAKNGKLHAGRYTRKIEATMPAINPEILVWARETAGYELSEAAQRLGLADGKAATGHEKLAAYEQGEKEPSRPLLLKMSKHYRRPLLTFYLDVPPARADRGRDFRTIHRAVDPSENGMVDALVRSIKVRQEVLREALASEQDHERLAFIGSYSLEKGADGLVSQIRAKSGFDLAVYRSKRSQEEAFQYLRERIENLGIFTMLIGNLGSHHTNLSSEIFRGFAIADPIAPFVVINDQDAKSAWPVTLLHEVSHLWLGQTGISGAVAEREVERFCDGVASELLIPETEIAANFSEASLRSLESAADIIGRFASERKVSSTLVAFRLMNRGGLSQDLFRSLSVFFYEKWRAHKEGQKQKAKENKGGPSYFVVKRMQNGKALMKASERLMRSGELTTTQAAIVLGVRALKVGSLLSQSSAV
ncbi:MAG: ImmA/IrrE family metallo-endopeptidase, partial [Pseudomonadota bacterium]